MFGYRLTPAPDVCKIPIGGSTPPAASNDHSASALSRRRRSIFAKDCSRRPANAALSPGRHDTNVSGRLGWARLPASRRRWPQNASRLCAFGGQTRLHNLHQPLELSRPRSSLGITGVGAPFSARAHDLDLDLFGASIKWGLSDVAGGKGRASSTPSRSTSSIIRARIRCRLAFFSATRPSR